MASIRHEARRSAGRVSGSMVLLLLLLVGGGGYHYYRNLEIERQNEGHRPYESYSTEDVQALRDAFESELTASEAKFAAAKRQRARPQGDLGSISGNVEQFAETTATSRAIRAAAAGVAERRDALSELDRELALRASPVQGLMHHLRRLTTI
ncbi:MAG: hypothetical protein CL931_13835 [Deltaproteobacteria bacterium]|nr:hypothetical protein [Deltaproteobacteria bacterium]